MAGYDGYSKSNNALDAEADGKYPLTHAVRIVAETAGCSQRVAREALKTVGPCEWHHTSMHYNRTNYYDTRIAAAYVNAKPLREFVAAHEDDLRAADKGTPEDMRECRQKLADEYGCTLDEIETIWLEAWDDLVK